MSTRHDDMPDDVRDVAEALRTHRPRLEPVELDRVKQRAMARSATPRKGAAMRSRLAIATMLVLGIVLSSGGAALGVSALSTSPSASAAQYGQPTTGAGGAPTPAGGVGPTLVGVGSTGPGGTTGSGRDISGFDDDAGVGGQGDEAPAGGEGGEAAPEVAAGQDAAAVQPARQLGVEEEGELPFTGYAAIPTLLLGLLLLGTGLMLRRRGRRVEA